MKTNPTTRNATTRWDDGNRVILRAILRAGGLGRERDADEERLLAI